MIGPEKKRPSNIGMNVIDPQNKRPVIGSARVNQVLPVAHQVESQKVIVGDPSPQSETKEPSRKSSTLQDMNSPMMSKSNCENKMEVNDSSIKDSKINININIQQKINLNKSVVRKVVGEPINIQQKTNLNKSVVRKVVGNPNTVSRDSKALKKSVLSKTTKKSSTMDSGKKNLIMEKMSDLPRMESIMETNLEPNRPASLSVSKFELGVIPDEMVDSYVVEDDAYDE